MAIDRPGRHVLVRSAYEATNWHVTLGADTRVSEVLLLGYEAQTVDLPGVPVTHGSGCGYSYPYNTAAGYQVDELRSDCIGSSAWEEAKFSTLSPPSCAGPRFVRRDERYNVWVGAIQCRTADRYKLYMSGALGEPFLEVADYAGYGQDHCELVNPGFKIPNEDDITSGGCADCSLGALVDVDGVPVYARAKFGEPFQRVQASSWADLTTTFYACGVAIP